LSENTADPQTGAAENEKEYGNALLCVRFRYDAKLQQRLKTIELIVERTEWTPPPPRYAADTLVPLRIEAADMPMRFQAKSAGGRWNPEKRLWFVKYDKIVGTPLEKHIPVYTRSASTGRCMYIPVDACIYM
jgi:hypothetical protein